jgi:hypothetical protein
MFAPEHRPPVAAAAAAALGDGSEHLLAPHYAGQPPLHQTELRPVDLIVGGGDRQHGRGDGLEVRRRVVSRDASTW